MGRRGAETQRFAVLNAVLNVFIREGFASESEKHFVSTELARSGVEGRLACAAAAKPEPSQCRYSTYHQSGEITHYNNKKAL
jgi:hypothetical protein